MTIKTNNQPRDLLTLWDFSPKDQTKIREDFNWLDDIDSNSTFFKYKGRIYNLSQFMRGGTEGWDGSIADSWSYCSSLTRYPLIATSGVLVRVSNDGEQVVCGSWNL